MDITGRGRRSGDMVRTAGKDMCWAGGRWRAEKLYVPHGYWPEAAAGQENKLEGQCAKASQGVT